MDNILASSFRITNFSAPQHNKPKNNFDNVPGDDSQTATGSHMKSDLDRVDDSSKDYTSVFMQRPNQMQFDEEKSKEPYYHNDKDGFLLMQPREFEVSRESYVSDSADQDGMREMNGMVKINGKETQCCWRHRLDEEQFPDTCDGTPFHIKLPCKPHSVDECKWARFFFSLPSDITNLSTLVEHMDNHDNSIEMEMDVYKAKQLFGSAPNIGSSEASIIPISIEIMSEHVDLPDDFNAELTSKAIGASSIHDKQRITWSKMSGAHNVGGKYNSQAHHMVHRKQCFDCPVKGKIMFLAPPLYNSAEFVRWINCDRKAIYNEIEKCSCSNNKEIEVFCAPDDAMVAQSIPQGVIINEWNWLTNYSKHIDVAVPQVTKNDNGTDVFKVNKKVIKAYFDQLFKDIDQNKIMMRVDNIKLTLKPLRKGTLDPTGMQLIRERADMIMKNFQLGDCTDPAYIPRYHSEIRIAYMECDHVKAKEETSDEMMPQKQSHISYAM